jgi:histone H3/H4
MSDLIVAKVLREIKYYQSDALADKLEIPKNKFALLIRQLLHDRDPTKKYKIEKDALVALQYMSEHILVMFLEMTYVSCIWS